MSDKKNLSAQCFFSPECRTGANFHFENKPYCRRHAPLGSIYGLLKCKFSLFGMQCYTNAVYGDLVTRAALRCQEHSQGFDIKYMVQKCKDCEHIKTSFYKDTEICIICARKHNYLPHKKVKTPEKNIYFAHVEGISFRPIRG